MNHKQREALEDLMKGGEVTRITTPGGEDEIYYLASSDGITATVGKFPLEVELAANCPPVAVVARVDFRELLERLYITVIWLD